MHFVSFDQFWIQAPYRSLYIRRRTREYINFSMDFRQQKIFFEIKMKMMINTSVYICIFLPSISWAGLYSPLMNDFLEKNFDINEVLIKIQIGCKGQLWIGQLFK